MRKSSLFRLEKGSQGSIRFYNKGTNYTRILMYGFVGVAFLFFIALILRLFQLTVVKGTYYRNLSENNRVREVILEPRRGRIEDRYGRVIAESTDVDVHEEGERISSHRTYYDPGLFAHIIGYRQVADDTDMKEETCLSKITPGDKVGKKGVEKLFDCYLRGKNGKKLIEINAPGKKIRTLSVVDPVPGDTIRLSIDYQLQKKAYETIEGKKAVVVALNPKTGEVLALASWPSFNPQAFEDNDAKKIEAYFTDEDRPLFNRATEGTYPPGSVYKMAVTTAALEEKIILPNTTITDTGVIEAGPARFHNWYYLEYGRTDGEVDAVKALQRSNDIFYYKIAEKMGPEKIKLWSTRFGFEKKTGIGLSEAEGIIPSPFWKEQVLKERWYTGDTYNLSIGQGYTLTTPLQVTVATMPFANGGYICKPNLLKVGDKNKNSELANVKEDCTSMGISQQTIDIVVKGMVKACLPGGTGVPFFDYRVRDAQLLSQVTPTPIATSSSIFADASVSAQIEVSTGSATIDMTKPIHVACKTGTAESFGEGFKPHAWFTIFAPLDDPEIILTVLVEEGGEGSKVAAPIAKEILTDYFERLRNE